ncbi:MAG: hypothetical protein FJY95_19565 [Candidatus Handelsmanbacteria bacterium]|nr:hypothetical protein [Candidatus Handelsmanbacteria bacterium]
MYSKVYSSGFGHRRTTNIAIATWRHETPKSDLRQVVVDSAHAEVRGARQGADHEENGPLWADQERWDETLALCGQSLERCRAIYRFFHQPSLKPNVQRP